MENNTKKRLCVVKCSYAQWGELITVEDCVWLNAAVAQWGELITVGPLHQTQLPAVFFIHLFLRGSL